MLLNLGLPADAAAAHTNEPSSLPEPSAPTSPSYSSAFSLPALPFLSALYNKNKQIDGPVSTTGATSRPAMSPVASTPTEGEPSQAAPPALARTRLGRSQTVRKSARHKTSYQFAHPAAHARHKRLKLRPKLLLQLQQVSQTPRPLPTLDVLPSTLYLPRLARKFPGMFRGRNGLGPNDLIVVMSELYGRTVSRVPEKQTSSEEEEDDHRDVVATICQMLHEDARLKGKAEICLNFGPVWEATPLASGSYEFVARTDNGVQVMRWALRGGRNRRTSAPVGGPPRESAKRFTFSIIDPNTRRHPVIASMTRNQLEVFDEYPMTVRSGTGHATPTSGMSVVSDVSDEPPTDGNVVALDDGLRTLIIITGIWVAFREGWSHNFSYGDTVSSRCSETPASPASKHGTTAMAKNESESPTDRDELAPVQEVTTGGKRGMSIGNVCRSNTMSPTKPPANGGKSFGSLSKRSNSTGAAFMDRAKRRSASAVSNGRLNRHSMFNGAGENGRDIVISRPPSLRQNSTGPEDATNQPEQPKKKSSSKPDRSSDLLPDRDLPKDVEPANQTAGKGKRRHRLSNIFTIFHRKHAVH